MTAVRLFIFVASCRTVAWRGIDTFTSLQPNPQLMFVTVVFLHTRRSHECIKSKDRRAPALYETYRLFRDHYKNVQLHGSFVPVQVTWVAD